MRKLRVVLRHGLFFCLFCHSLVFATPDPRDSVIIESKTVNPGSGPVAARVRVSITNKDTLATISLCLVSRSLTGGAYMTLARPRTFDGVITLLGARLTGTKALNTIMAYNSISPDTFNLGLAYDPLDTSTYEYPNPTRKPYLEIKFDTVKTSIGALELDSANISRYGYWSNWTEFITPDLREIKVNLVKGTITVAAPSPPPCDLSGDGGFTAADLVTAINCVYLGIGDCGSIKTPADIVSLLNFLFSNPGPLIPPPNCE